MTIKFQNELLLFPIKTSKYKKYLKIEIKQNFKILIVITKPLKSLRNVSNLVAPKLLM